MNWNNFVNTRLKSLKTGFKPSVQVFLIFRFGISWIKALINCGCSAIQIVLERAMSEPHLQFIIHSSQSKNFETRKKAFITIHQLSQSGILSLHILNPTHLVRPKQEYIGQEKSHENNCKIF